jgi:trimeric autotransporter adhesin
MHSTKFIGIAVLAASSLAPTLCAQAIFTNPITATNPSASNPFTAGQTVDDHLNVSGIGRGSGITASSAADRYSASNWNSASLNATDYFTWTLTPVTGYQLNLSSFIYIGQASGTGPTSFALRSSVDGFSTNIGTPPAGGTTITLTSSAFQGLTESVEFRLYGWNASSASGSFSVNDFTFNGMLSAVPEPSTYAALAGLATLGAAIIRRRRRAT